MSFIVKGVASILLAATSEAAPPPAPNFCGGTFCLELQPMLDAERKKFVKIQRDLLELDDRSWMRLKYADLGEISIFGPFSSDLREDTVSYDELKKEISIILCIKNGIKDSCDRYIISILDNGIAEKPLICSIFSFWPTSGAKNSPVSRLGARVDVARNFAERCL